MLRFMADEYDDTCSTVFPLLQNILTTVRRWLMQIYMIDKFDCSTNAIGKYLQIH